MSANLAFIAMAMSLSLPHRRQRRRRMCRIFANTLRSATGAGVLCRMHMRARTAPLRVSNKSKALCRPTCAAKNIQLNLPANCIVVVPPIRVHNYRDNEFGAACAHVVAKHLRRRRRCRRFMGKTQTALPLRRHTSEIQKTHPC